MTNARAAVLIATAVVAVACTRRTESVPQAAAAADNSAVITLERKPCYGFCSVYFLTVSATGDVVFEGRQHVDSVGVHNARIEPARVDALVKLFDAAQFYSLEDRYVMGAPACAAYASDAPTIITYIKTKDHTKRVEHDVGCAGVPQRLSDLERQIDSVVGTIRWTGRK